MSAKHEFCDHCPGCRPALLDLATGKPLAEDTPVMIAVNKIWDNDTTYAQRKAFVAITWHQSKKPDDVKLAMMITQKIEKALRENPVLPK